MNVNTQANLMNLTNKQLLAVGTKEKNVTLLENELLHRLEAYIELYGDFLEVDVRRH